MSDIDDVMARIAQLQQLVAPPAQVTTGSSNDSADFSSTLAAQTDPDSGTTTTAATTAATPAMTTYAPTTPATPATTTSTLAGTMTSTLATGATTAAGTQVTGNDVVADSIQYLGVPYKWGGTNPTTGLDCSGLVQKVFADKGVALPRTSAEQATTGTEVAGGLANAQPGDLVFFGSPVHHVGIYAGNGMMVEAPHTGTNVQVHSIDETPTHVRRIALPIVAPAAAAPVATLGAITPAATTTAATVVPALTTAAATTTALPGMTATTAASSTLAALSAADPNTAMDALGVPAELRSVFTSAAQSQNLPVSLLAAVAKVESGYSTTETSSAGAQGMMQLMPDTAAGIGANPWDPASAANGAAKLLRGYIDQYGSVPLALAAYNAGPGAVAKYGGVPPYAETQAYVQRVGALAAAA